MVNEDDLDRRQTYAGEDVEDALTCAVMTSLLRVGRSIDRLSSILLLVQGYWIVQLALNLPAKSTLSMMGGIGLILALFEKYYAWRVGFDAELFAMLVRLPAQLEVFDRALERCLGIRLPISTRSMHERWKGARSLLLAQCVTCAAQAICIMAMWTQFVQ